MRLSTAIAWTSWGALIAEVLARTRLPGAGVVGAGLGVSALALLVTGSLARGTQWTYRRFQMPRPRGGSPALREAAQRTIGPLVRSAVLNGVVVGALSRCDDPSGDEAVADVLAWGHLASSGLDTRLEIGSITKTLTGVLLADLSLQGVTTLTSDVGLLVDLPQLRGVTLLDLATHCSGLPRLPGALVRRALLMVPDPYCGISEARLLASVPSSAPRRTAQPRYSNLGFALLGAALARAAARPFSTLLAERVLIPLGLTSTSFATPDVLGHDRFGLPVSTWSMSAYAPTGALCSTAADMLRLASAVLSPPPHAAGEAVALATRPHAPRGQGGAIGLGWMLDGGLVWHNGATAGACAWLGADRTAGTAAVVLAPSSHRPAFDERARALLRAITSPQGR